MVECVVRPNRLWQHQGAHRPSAPAGLWPPLCQQALISLMPRCARDHLCTYALASSAGFSGMIRPQSAAWIQKAHLFGVDTWTM